ncbi:hypothetical protein C5N14_12170 [Micromonospora sp. MW-13]|uniref:hypothetical protein n=1 Tax=Micromonospora sp. MW-13 TaxID=2094022 RepID=UPI000EE9B75D|nr:hypothetical protein [Micromonospora sp. MW-13]RGC68745.1 hypothetical protein C5N14_12170 [Micromonospora sp. MW-13]
MTPMTPQKLAQTRILDVNALARNEVDLRTYPHRHLVLVARPGLTHSGVTQLMEGVEYLCQFGWELVNVTDGNPLFYAFLRRR